MRQIDHFPPNALCCFQPLSPTLLFHSDLLAQLTSSLYACLVGFWHRNVCARGFVARCLLACLLAFVCVCVYLTRADACRKVPDRQKWTTCAAVCAPSRPPGHQGACACMHKLACTFAWMHAHALMLACMRASCCMHTHVFANVCRWMHVNT